MTSTAEVCEGATRRVRRFLHAGAQHRDAEEGSSRGGKILDRLRVGNKRNLVTLLLDGHFRRLLAHFDRLRNATHRKMKIAGDGLIHSHSYLAGCLLKATRFRCDSVRTGVERRDDVKSFGIRFHRSGAGTFDAHNRYFARRDCSAIWIEYGSRNGAESELRRAGFEEGGA